MPDTLSASSQHLDEIGARVIGTHVQDGGDVVPGLVRVELAFPDCSDLAHRAVQRAVAGLAPDPVEGRHRLLEYDHVIIPNLGRIDDVCNLYVALTRARQSITIIGPSSQRAPPV